MLIIWILLLICDDIYILITASRVDPSSLHRKVLIGYQGWFETPQFDGRWRHWCSGSCSKVRFDAWPDMGEYSQKYLTPLGNNWTYGDGSAAKVFSSLRVVDLHFKWMQQYGLDGVALQRFLTDMIDSIDRRDAVLHKVMMSALKYERTFCVMYDITGYRGTDWVTLLLQDWHHLIHVFEVIESDQYLHHNGKPVLGLWGLGFDHNSATPEQALQLLHGLGDSFTVLGGVPTHWRQNTLWAKVYRSLDIISPWTVGRMNGTLSNADDFAQTFLAKDASYCREYGMEYLPVVFPGYSASHLNASKPLNEIPRSGGTFMWRQFYNVATWAQATMVYVAMMDEVDEATAIFKLVASRKDLPDPSMYSLDMDPSFSRVPSDWYLRLTGTATSWWHSHAPGDHFPKRMPPLPLNNTFIK